MRPFRFALRCRALILTGALLALVPALLHAQVDSTDGETVSKPFGRTTGLFAGLHYVGTAPEMGTAFRKVSIGGRFGVHAGLGFGNRVAAILQIDRMLPPEATVDADSLRVLQYDVQLRMHVLAGPGSPIRPFVTAGFTSPVFGSTAGRSVATPIAGGGVLLKILPQLALTGTAFWKFGNLTSIDALSTDARSQALRATGSRATLGASLFVY